MVSQTSSPFDQLDLAFHFTYKVLKKVLQAQTISGFVVHQQQMMISTNEESQSKKIHGLVEFTQPVRLNKVQQGQANGYKENVIIDWGDFERQKWDQLSPKIESIKCKQLSLRNNRNRNLIMNVKHISFPHLVVLNLGSNKICSLQVLPSFNLPVLRQLNLDDNFIISTRSFVKAHLPQLKTIRLQNNPLVENSRMFQGLFPKLREYWLDIDTTKEYTYGTLKLTDQVTWRVKHAPKLTKQSQLNRGNRMNYHYRRYGYELDHFQPKRLTFVKYVEMLNQKPEYFKTQMVQY